VGEPEGPQAILSQDQPLYMLVCLAMRSSMCLADWLLLKQAEHVLLWRTEPAAHTVA